MGEALKMVKLPKIDVPRPVRWDFIAFGALLAGLILIGVALVIAGRKAPEAPFPSAAAMVLIVMQLVVSCGGLMLLGKTAKEGTWWGNLASLAAMLIGMSGVLLATALW